MSTATSRLGLDEPQSTENISGFPAEDVEALGVLDNAVIVTQGTYANLPAIGSTPYGNEYYATDIAKTFKALAGSWVEVPTGGPTVFTATGNYANGNPSVIRNQPSAVWGASAQLVSGTMQCVNRHYRFTFRTGFIGIDLEYQNSAIYGLQFKLVVDGSPVTLDDGSAQIAYPSYIGNGTTAGTGVGYQPAVWLFNPSYTFSYTPAAGSHTFAVVVYPDSPGASAQVEGPYELIVG